MNDDPHYRTGAVLDLGSYLFTAEEIIAFARKYDPQPFHIDEEAARASVFGSLCASGWHTASIWMKLRLAAAKALADERTAAGLENFQFGPSPGFKNLNWYRPVFAGEVIRYRQTMTEMKPFSRMKGWSILSGLGEAFTEDGTRVMSFENAVLASVPPEFYRS